MITAVLASRSVVERNIVFFRRDWPILLGGFLEPFFWLIGIGAGLDAIVGSIDVGGTSLSYRDFVAPALIGVAAMNGAAFDATFNFFFKLRQSKTFDSMLTTPLSLGNVVVGEILWSVLRSSIYGVGFLAIIALMGIVTSPWAVLIIPVGALLGFSVAAIGIFATTFVRTWHDFDYFTLVLQVLFLGSATFYPLSVYPDWAQWFVNATPLYHGVALIRTLAFGAPDFADLGHVAVLGAFTAAFGWMAHRRLGRALLP